MHACVCGVCDVRAVTLSVSVRTRKQLSANALKGSVLASCRLRSSACCLRPQESRDGANLLSAAWSHVCGSKERGAREWPLREERALGARACPGQPAGGRFL